jgi:hypothetical protein
MGWMKTVNSGDCETGKVNYSAFASDLEAYCQNTLKKVRCPVCRKELSASSFFQNPKAVNDEPMAMFEPECSNCYTVMTIFND